MSAVKEVFSILAAKAEEAIPVRDCDYLGEDGLLICGKCHTPKQCRPFPGSDLAVYCLCKCQQEEDRAMQERLRRNQIEQRRTICFGTSDLIRATFAEDDGKNPKLTEVCKTFSANLNDSSSWLLLWGDCIGIDKPDFASLGYDWFTYRRCFSPPHFQLFHQV